MRRWFVDIPAAIVDAYCALWRLLLLVGGLVGLGSALIVLLLAALGIRWGW